MAVPYSSRIAILLAVAVVAAVWLFSLAPIPTNPAFHCFADQRPFLGVPHFLNVVSNLPFLLVGAAGIGFLCSTAGRRGSLGGEPTIWTAYCCFFAGVGLTAFGSTYYHLDPGNARLLWDRLPMTVAFMGMFAAMIGERISTRAAAILLVPLLAAGVWSVLYWNETEQLGHGDLRPYYFVQFFSLAAIPLILALFPAKYTRTGDLLLALGWYALAKFLENPLDDRVFRLGHAVSGHTLKHLAAAMGAYQILRMLRLRHIATRSVSCL